MRFQNSYTRTGAWNVVRRTLSRVLFSLGLLLVAAAVALMVWARLHPSNGMATLGWFVFGLILFALAGIPFSLALLTARRAGPGFLVTAWLGAGLGTVAGISFLTTGTPSLVALGAVEVALALAGAVRGIRLWREGRTASQG